MATSFSLFVSLNVLIKTTKHSNGSHLLRADRRGGFLYLSELTLSNTEAFGGWGGYSAIPNVTGKLGAQRGEASGPDVPPLLGVSTSVLLRPLSSLSLVLSHLPVPTCHLEKGSLPHSVPVADPDSDSVTWCLFLFATLTWCLRFSL